MLAPPVEVVFQGGASGAWVSGGVTGAGGTPGTGGVTGGRLGACAGPHPIVEFELPNKRSQPRGIAAGPDGNLWFTEYNADIIGRISPAGAITEFPVRTGNSGPFGITAGRDGNIWFTEVLAHRVGYVTTTER